MAAPFGFSVGDFVTVGKLIGQIVRELREVSRFTVDDCRRMVDNKLKIDGAASEYQWIVIELRALQRALDQLQTLQPAKHELLQLTSIRATVLACQRPLRNFLDKISKFERRLGTFNTAGSKWSGFPRRVQFGFLFKEDIKELRSALASHIGTINVLLMTQSVASISIAEKDRERHASSLENTILAHRQLLRNVDDRVGDCLTQQWHTQIRLRNQDAILVALDDKIGSTSDQVCSQAASIQCLQTAANSTQEQTKSILRIVTDALDLLTSGMLQIHQIAQQLQSMFRICVTFTAEMRRTMAKVMELFVNIQALLQRIDRNLPARPFLPIVQFTTALGDTIALPLQLCQQWTTFTELLNVVFINKPGQHRVQLGLYSVMNARSGKFLNNESWQHAVMADDHLSMSIILDNLTGSVGNCPFPSCNASIEGCRKYSGGLTCQFCGRWFLLTTAEQQHSLSSMSGMDPRTRVNNSNLAFEQTRDQQGGIKEDVDIYRRIHLRLPGNEAATSHDVVAEYASSWNKAVPNDIWICGECRSANITFFTDQQCPTCGHFKDYSIGCCQNPGEFIL